MAGSGANVWLEGSGTGEPKVPDWVTGVCRVQLSALVRKYVCFLGQGEQNRNNIVII